MCKTINILVVLIATMSGGLLFSGCTTVSKSRPTVPQPTYMSQRVMSHGVANPQAMLNLFRRGNPSCPPNRISQLVRYYLHEAKMEGVNPDLAFCQMCLETNYLQFGGQVKSWQHNYCGLGAVDGGAPGCNFETAHAGVRAHIQHLKAYGSYGPLANPCIDPRFKFVKRGSAPTIANLAGRWASDKEYGKKLSFLLSRLHIY